MNRWTLSSIGGAAAIFALALQAPASATDGHAWNDHRVPLTFHFGNDIDGHQESRLQPNGNLFGFLYIHFTGVTTLDGHRVASHADCSATPGCVAGWVMLGAPRTGAFLYHEMDDHPVYLVARNQLPQPGVYTHFHRVGPDEHSSGDGYLLQLFAIDSFCFIHHDAGSADPAKTCADNGGIAVSPGADAATHLNIVTSFPGKM
jgi:hypothetical protein